MPAVEALHDGARMVAAMTRGELLAVYPNWGSIDVVVERYMSAHALPIRRGSTLYVSPEYFIELQAAIAEFEADILPPERFDLAGVAR